MSDPAGHRTRALLPAFFRLLAAVLFPAPTTLSRARPASLGPFTQAGLLRLGGALGVLPFGFRGSSPEPRQDRRTLPAVALVLGGVGVASRGRLRRVPPDGVPARWWPSRACAGASTTTSPRW